MSRWWSAGVGWLRPPGAASRSAPPASAAAISALSDREAANDGRRLPRLPRLGPADRGRAVERARRRRPGAGRLAAGPGPVRRAEAAMILAVWLLSLPFRLLAALGLRRSVILACLFVLAATAFGVAQDLGLLEPPAQAAPARRAASQPTPSQAAVVDIPAGYLRLYRQAGARYRIPWAVLAGIGKVESDHGRTRLPGVRSGSNWAGACGPMQLGCVPGSRAGNAWARYGHGHPHDPTQAIPAATRYLVDHGARHHLDWALFAYNHSWAYVVKVKALARRYAGGGGRR